MNNIFILVEGRAERKIYPKWLAQLVPHLSKVSKPALVSQSNYCIISSDGYNSLVYYLKEAIEEVNDIGTFNFLVVIADSDDKTVAEREVEIQDYLTKNDIKLNSATDLVIILQRCCLETWFLGNRQIFTENPQDAVLEKWIKHFNVSIDDPETMPLPLGYDGAIGNFHKMYAEKMQIEYYKNRNSDVPKEATHLTAMIERFNETGHIATFGKLLNFCEKLNKLDD